MRLPDVFADKRVICAGMAQNSGRRRAGIGENWGNTIQDSQGGYLMIIGGKIWCATILKGARCRCAGPFAPLRCWCTCGEVLMHINHPRHLHYLSIASEQGKRCHDRMTKTFVRFPHAALAALAELLAQRSALAHDANDNAYLTNPTLAERVIPVSTPAVAVLKSCQQQLTQPSNHASADMLPAVLVSPPWLSKRKNL